MNTIDSIESAYMIMALRRRSVKKGENVETKESNVKTVVKSYETIDDAVARIENILKDDKGFWRIYVSANTRNFEKGRKRLLKDMIDKPQDAFKVDSVWKKCLMNPKCKHENNILVDIDTKDMTIVENVKSLLKEINAETIRESETVNGFHILVKAGFNTRSFTNVYPAKSKKSKEGCIVELKYDALMFVKTLDLDKDVVSHYPNKVEDGFDIAKTLLNSYPDAKSIVITTSNNIKPVTLKFNEDESCFDIVRNGDDLKIINRDVIVALGFVYEPKLDKWTNNDGSGVYDIIDFEDFTVTSMTYGKVADITKFDHIDKLILHYVNGVHNG